MRVIEQDYAWAAPLAKRKATAYLVLHHEAASGFTAQDIHRYHLSKGWSGIAYHYYVRKSGAVYRGRPEDTVGAHTSGYNGVSIGVCFEGNFETDTMFAQQYAAGKALILDILGRYPGVRVVGHRDLNATACPGKNFPLEEYRRIKVREDEAMERFNTVAELPSWAAATVKKLCNRGVVQGRGSVQDEHGYPADLDLSEDMLRLLVWNDRAGVYDGGDM